MLDYQLLQIGFTDSEARVYLELLTIGPQPVSVVAKRIHFNRTTTYSVLKSLEKRGVVSSFNNNGLKCFSANDPNCLISFLDSKCRTLDFYREELLVAIPKFRSLNNLFDFKKPVVSYFDGIEGVKHVMYDALNAVGDFYAYMCIDKWLDVGLKDFLIEYKNFRIYNRKVSLKAIVADLPQVRSFFDDNYKNGQKEMTKIHYLDPANFSSMFENEMNIYDDKVAIIHLEKGSEYGVLIENSEIAAMHKTIFEMVWKGLNR